LLVLADTRSGQGLHGADDGLEISGAVDLSAQVCCGVAHSFSLPAAFGFGSDFGLALSSISSSVSCFGPDVESGSGENSSSDLRAISIIAHDPHRSIFGGIQSLAHLRRDIRRRLAHGVLGVRHLVKRHGVEEFRGQRQQHGDLRGHRHRGEFRLFEAGADSPSVLDDLAGVFIQAGAEPGKGLEFLKLRVGRA
jgi:hypothetical protein